jgi:hypothetical protein
VKASAVLLGAALLASSAPAAEDGAHAFDFDFGTWKTHSERLLHPLTGSTEWKEMDGVTVVTPLAGGKANIAEYKAEGSAGTVELLALRTYDPATGQWYTHFSHPGTGTLDVPGIGRAADGKIVFYDQETLNGNAIWVRFSIWKTGEDTAQSEQAFSNDAGRSWEVNWVNKYSRIR